MPLSSVSWIFVWIPSRKYEKSNLQVPGWNAQYQLTANSGVTDNANAVDLIEDTTFEEVLEDVLTTLKAQRRTTVISDDGNHKLVQFSVKEEDVEIALIRLQQYGIGNREHTCVSVVPASIHFESEPVNPVAAKQRQSVISQTGADNETDGAAARKDSVLQQADDTGFGKAYNDFYSSIKSRLLVAEVITRIRAGALFTFDYLVLLVLAAMIAFFGLTEDSSVVLVASMLVSPMMGPILAGVFGTVINDKPLRNYGVKIEVISLFICVLIGFVMGIIYCPFVDNYGLRQFPTVEMISRGRQRNLVVGILIAIPSGAGVALSVLGGNSGSLVGVAISASLLPPAVNAGALWALAICSAVREDSGIIGLTFNKTAADHSDTIRYFQPAFVADDTQADWAMQTFILGFISLMLTIANILCIIVTGIGILWIKEVTPDKIPQQFSEFWKRDVRAHREYYKTVNKQEGEDLVEEARRVLGLGAKSPEGLEGTFLQQVFEQAHKEDDYIDICKWISMPPAPVSSSGHQVAPPTTPGSGGGGGGSVVMDLLQTPRAMIGGGRPFRFRTTSQMSSVSGYADTVGSIGGRPSYAGSHVQPNIAKVIKLGQPKRRKVSSETSNVSDTSVSGNQLQRPANVSDVTRPNVNTATILHEVEIEIPDVNTTDQQVPVPKPKSS